MDETYDFDVPAPISFGESASGESLGETENFFSVPYFQRHEQTRRKCAKNEAHAIRRETVANQRKNRVQIVEPEPVEVGRDAAPAKRRKIQPVHKPPTVPKAPSFMSRTKAEKTEKKKTDSKAGNLSEFYKKFPTTAPELKQKRKPTVVQPFHFTIREEQKKRERENRKRENAETISDDEITFRPPIRRPQLPKPKVPRENTEAPPKQIKRKKWAPTKAVTPTFRVDKRATTRKALKEQNSARSKNEEDIAKAVKAEEQQRNEEDLKKARALTVHRPNEIRRYKGVPDRVTTSITVAVTPKLKTGKRQRK